jgi:hypothetical protein
MACLVVLEGSKTKRQVITIEAIERSPSSLEGEDDICSKNSFSVGAFSVQHSVPNDILKKHLENISGFLIYKRGYSFDSSSSG